ncbi:cystathionine gamma-synthase family protein [Agaribacter flavus]|uniref:Cystathionine gamma-synthase family protein n=1 Tax=Agaribacter flavus TaxID=1902781 RepID=A0ABV7FMU3_9ALTE
MKPYALDTHLVHTDRLLNSPEDGAVHTPTSNSVLFEFEDVSDLEAVFQGKKTGHVYSRSSSGSAVALQNLLNDLEGGVAATVFSTGMAAISATLFSLLRTGDHIVVSQFLFGNTRSFMQALEDFGVQISFVDISDSEQVSQSITDNTKMVFCETIANPVTQVAALQEIGEICAQENIILVVDNTMTPFVMFDSKAVKSSLVITSLTKYIAGHGSVLGGVVVDTGLFDWRKYPNILEKYKGADANLWGMTQIRKRGLRDIGATLAPSSAHPISVGLETLKLRMQRSCENALAIARYMHASDKFKTVHYPGLDTHPHHQRASQLFDGGYGAILSFELADGIDFREYLNKLALVINATHLGDTRTLALPVSSTIFYENGAEQRKAMGISENLIRLSVGIEDTQDLLNDFASGFR